MKKNIAISVFSILCAFFLTLSVGSAYSITTSLTSTDGALSELSDMHSVSGKSAHLWAMHDTAVGKEGRVRIEFVDDVTLNDITNISWNQYLEQGYIAHVDVMIDTNDDGTEDDALVFEYAKVDSSNCDVEPYPSSGTYNTFDDRGIVDNNAYAWLSSGPPGPCGDSGFIYHSLTDWKTGVTEGGKTVNGDTTITAIEIEVDGWIEESEAFIDDVMLNGMLIEDLEESQGGEGTVGTDFTFLANPDPLNFGTIRAGQSKTAVSTLSIGASDLTVQEISVTPSTGLVFNEDNVLFSQDSGATYMMAMDWDPLDIMHGSSSEVHVQLSIPSGTPSGDFSGQIVYTVMETQSP